MAISLIGLTSYGFDNDTSGILDVPTGTIDGDLILLLISTDVRLDLTLLLDSPSSQLNKQQIPIRMKLTGK